MSRVEWASGHPSPQQRYAAELAAGAMTPDPAQAEAVAKTQQLYEALCKVRHGGGLLARTWVALTLSGPKSVPVRGLYLWGGVGRGKSHIMNALHESLPFEQKLRIHFHSFMLHVHTELKTLKQQSDPLQVVADRLAQRARVICFDEFHVADIADAMLLGRLLEALFARGVTLVATSNIEPRALYRDGLKRDRFIPAIEALEAHTLVHHVASPMDYRLRALSQAEIYLCPLGPESEAGMARCFEALRPEDVQFDVATEIAGRRVQARALADGIAWFEFAELCETSRSASDYIEIGQRYHTVLLANVPIMDDLQRDRTLRFIHFVDEIYDRNVNVIVSAQGLPSALYQGERYRVGFARAASRLEEMRSTDYLARPHLLGS